MDDHGGHCGNVNVKGTNECCTASTKGTNDGSFVSLVLAAQQFIVSGVVLLL